MKTLYFECNMGAAGDMLMAALSELLPNPEEFIKRMNDMGIPGVSLTAERAEKCGVNGTHVSVKIHGAEEESHDHSHEHTHTEHEHDHEHSHTEHMHDHNHGEHHHSGIHEIEHIISHLNMPENVKRDVLEVYRLIAEAESRAHGKPVTEVHFHEVGAMDAVADIAGVCLLIRELNPDRIVASPIHVGSGQVKCAHGILPVPAPATAHILRGVPTYGGSIMGELCTPTGAALLKYFAAEFGAMPVMSVSKIGYGMGKKDFPAANCVRVFIGDSGDNGNDEILELSANIDDMTGEAIGFAMDRLFEAGALDVFTVAIGMKKSRPGIMLTCLVKTEDKKEVVEAFFKHTTTIGIREKKCSRYVLNRQVRECETNKGAVRVKVSEGYGTVKSKIEFEDAAKIALENDLSVLDIKLK